MSKLADLHFSLLASLPLNVEIVKRKAVFSESVVDSNFKHSLIHVPHFVSRVGSHFCRQIWTLLISNLTKRVNILPETFVALRYLAVFLSVPLEDMAVPLVRKVNQNGVVVCYPRQSFGPRTAYEASAEALANYGHALKEIVAVANDTQLDTSIQAGAISVYGAVSFLTNHSTGARLEDMLDFIRTHIVSQSAAVRKAASTDEELFYAFHNAHPPVQAFQPIFDLLGSSEYAYCHVDIIVG